MTISRRQVLLAVLAVSLVTGAVYAVSWSGDWQRRGDGVQVETFPLDVSRFGLAPGFYWLPAPDRLVLVPAALVPWEPAAREGDPVPGAADGEVLVVDLTTGRTGWQRSSQVAGPHERQVARHVFWSLLQHLDKHSGEEILHAGPHDRGPSVVLTFDGFGIPVPTYNANVPPFGEPGWRLQRRRFGRWRLATAGSGSNESRLELTLAVFNSSHEVELSSLAAWLPGGRYLVLTPKTGSPTLLLAGPFQSASPNESTSIDRG